MKRLRKQFNPHTWRSDTVRFVRDGITARIEERWSLVFYARGLALDVT